MIDHEISSLMSANPDVNLPDLLNEEQHKALGELKDNLGQKIVIPAGSSFALGLTPPAGNTSTLVNLGVTLIKQTLDIT